MQPVSMESRTGSHQQSVRRTKVLLQPDTRGIYNLSDTSLLSLHLSVSEQARFLNGLNSVRNSMHRIGIYILLSLVFLCILTGLMFALKSSSPAMIVCFALISFGTALVVRMIESYFERKEADQISWHLGQSQRIYQDRGISFEMRKIQPDADLIAEGSSQLIGALEILIGVPISKE